MGLISKVEAKLGGGDKSQEQRYEDQNTTSPNTTHGSHGRSSNDTYGTNTTSNTLGSHGRSSNDTYGTNTTSNTGDSRLSERQHPVSSSTNKGSGIVGGTALTGGAGSEAFTGAHGHGREADVLSTGDRLRDTHLGGSTAADAGPRQPFNPYSSKGQQIAANAGSGNTTHTGTTHAGTTHTGNTYGASQGRAEAGDIGSRRDADHPEVRRTQGGGISNSVTDTSFNSGPHSHLENRDAVPTAGGHKVGSGASSNMPGSFDNYDDSSSTQHGQHHYGRDAAVAGGAGAAGYGAYEATHDNSGPGPAPNTAGPHKSDMLNKIDPRVKADPAAHDDYGHETGVGSDKYHAQTSSSNYPDSSTTSHGRSGIDRRTYDTSSSNTSKYGQDVSYMNRPSADTPLTQSKDFSDRHGHNNHGTTAGAAGVGAGAGALGATALGHHHGENKNVTGGNYGNQSSTTGSSIPGVSGTSSHNTSSNDDHMVRASEMAKRMGGAYEAGYRDGYRDAAQHKAAQV